MKKILKNILRTGLSVCLLIALVSLSTGVTAKADDGTSVSKAFVINRKVSSSFVNSSTPIFSLYINVVQPGTALDSNKDVYDVTYSFTKKQSDVYRLLDFKVYVNNPTFYYTYWGGTQLGSGAYVWDESIQAWRMENPFEDNGGVNQDTSLSYDGHEGVRFYYEAKNSENLVVLPYSELSHNENAEGSRQAIVFGSLDEIPFDVTQSAKLNLYQEKLPSTYGNPGAWYGWNYSSMISYEYEYDGKVTATNPVSVLNLTPGESVHFDSLISFESAVTFNSTMTWQVSRDGGLTFTDIEGTTTSSNSSQEVTKNLDFTPELSDEGALYRVKVTPTTHGVEESLYTEAATLSFKKVNVVFQDWDTTVLKTDTISYGTSAVAPSQPTRDGYTFIGWDRTYDNVTEDIIVTALYQGNDLKVTFIDWDNKVLKIETGISGWDATAPADPVREGYTFIGWDREYTNIIEDTEVHALYEINDYTVTFVDHDGTTLKQEVVAYGNDATAPADPVREGYTFIGWDREFTNVKEDLTVTAIYQKTPTPPNSVGNVIVNYQDKSGHTIHPSTSLQGDVGQSFKIEVLNIENYEFVEASASLDGEYTIENQSITLIYQKNDAVRPVLPNTGVAINSMIYIVLGIGSVSLLLAAIMHFHLRKKNK